MKLFKQTPAIFGLLIVFLIAAAASGKNEQTFYKITIDENSPRLAKIEASFVLQDNLLFMQKYGADQFRKRWAEFVRNLNARDAKGKPLKIEEMPGAHWKIDAPAGQKINLNYEIILKHDEHNWAGGIDGVAFAKNWGVFYTGKTWLISNGKDRKDILISFETPKNRRVTASWNADKNKANSFIAKNQTELSESMFFIGTYEEFVINRDGFELVFALGGEGVAAQKDGFRNLAQGVLDYYINLMGGIPNPPPDNKFTKSLVVINAGKEMDGEVIGNHISMILDPEADPQSQIISRFIFAHEFFHLWNGKSVNVADTTEDWFKEGVTSYYTLKALNRAGLLNEQAFFAVLNNLFFKRYMADEGLGKSSMRDVASGASKDKHWGLIYGGGLFAGICQDIAVRKETGNQKSLDDLMRAYFKNYGGTNKTYKTADLQKSFTELSGKDQTDFFKQYVFGFERVPIEQCLSDAGLNAEIKNGELKVSRKTSPDKLGEAILNGVLGL